MVVAPPPNRQRVVFVLIDGARHNVLRALLDRGDLPNVARSVVEPGGWTVGTTVFPSTTGVSLEGGPAEAAATASFRRAMRFVPWIKWFGGVRRVRDKVRDGLIAASGDPGWVTDSVVEAYTAGAKADLDATLKAFLRMASAEEPERLVPHLGEIRSPVVLLLGTAAHEGGVGPEEVELLRRALVSFAIDSVSGSGHYIHEEQPAAVVAAVERIRTRLAVESGRPGLATWTAP